MKTADEHGLSGRDAALYDMIWKRTMATQMADAQLTLITANIQADDTVFQANGRRVDFPGFFRVYVEGTDDPDAALEDQAVLLPPLTKGDAVQPRQLDPLGHETQPPARFTEASLIQTLEKEGVGRPSTYATIIGTIQDRGYAIKNGNNLTPTFTAFAVNRLLEKHFPDLVDTGFTARMEQRLDDIADGNAEWLSYLKTFYLGENGLETQVSQKEQSIDPREVYAIALAGIDARVKIGRYGPYLEGTVGDELLRTSLPPEMPPAELSNENALKLLQVKEKGPDSLGNDPVTGLPVLVLSGRYGPYVQLGENPTDKKAEKPKRASLLKGMTAESLTLASALNLLSLPRDLGVDPQTGEAITAAVGRLGPFVKRGSEYRSLATSDNVLTVELARAIELFAQPKTSGRGRGRTATPQKPLRELGVHPTDGSALVVLEGRYGPYVKWGDVNATVPKGTPIESLTLAQAIELVNAKAAKSPAKPKTRRTTRTRTKPGTKEAATEATPEKPKTPRRKTPAASTEKVTKTPKPKAAPKRKTSA
jgi:DNA topoisomerase-1